MLAKWLRGVLLAELLILLAVWWGLGSGPGMSGLAALGICIALFFAVNSVIPATTGILAAVYARRLDERIRPRFGDLMRAELGDWLAFLALFIVIQPFAGWWMRSDRGRAPSREGRLVVLVHGYCCNRGLWWWFARELRKGGVSIASVDLEPPLAGIDVLAAGLAKRINALVAEREPAKIVLIAHSMGGLVARACLHRYGAGRVEKLITLATPHSGTELAQLGLGCNARQMQPGSAWIRQLNETGTPAVPTVAIWSASDNFVLPQDHGRLPGAPKHRLRDLGHLSMVFSPRVLGLVLDALSGGASV
jgi:triacylglycerol lipase